MESTKDKIDKVLGLSDGESIDDFLDGMSLDADKVSETMNQISEEVKDSLEVVDRQLEEVQRNPDSGITIVDMNASMKEVQDLIVMSKAMFKHIYENVVSSELLDSELIGSASKMLESIHLNIQEFISLYRDRVKFIEKIKMMIFQQNLKKELMDKKHQQDLEKIKMKAEADVVDTTASSAGSMSQEDAVKLLAKMSGSQLDEMLGIPQDIDIEEQEKHNDNIKEN